MGRIRSLVLAVSQRILRSAAVGWSRLLSYLNCGRFGCCLRPELQPDYVEAAGGPGDCIGIDKLTFVTLLGVQILPILQVSINFIYL